MTNFDHLVAGMVQPVVLIIAICLLAAVFAAYWS